MGFPLKTKFEAPADTHTALVVTDHYWGRGKDKDKAMAQTKAEGGRPGYSGYVVYYFGEGFKEDTGWVDGMGYVHWEWTEEVAAGDGEKPFPVKEEVLPKQPTR